MADEPIAGRASRRPWWVTLTGNVALGLLGLLVALLLGELMVRLAGFSYTVYVWTDPVRGMAHIPGAKSVRQSNGRPWVEINRDGWRGPEVPLAAPPGTFRIALLGDSYIEAFEVPFEKTVGELLEGRLSALRGTPVDVLNFGHGGYGTTQELLTLQHEVWKYSPDLVLLAVTTGNDISDNSRSLKRIDYVPYHVFQGDRLVLDTSFRQAEGYRSRAIWTRRLLFLMQHSRLAQLVNRVRRTSRKTEQQQANRTAGEEVGMRDEVHLPPATPEWEEAWRVTEALIGLMRDECRTHGTPFAMVTLSRGIQVSPMPEEKQRFLRALGAPDLYYAERRLADLGRRDGIPVLNLAPTMADRAIRDQVYYHAHQDSLGVGHWSEAGHRAAADLIAGWLATEFSDTTATPHAAADRSP
jgi:GDSL-like Lipase/Acylhydrolase family